MKAILIATIGTRDLMYQIASGDWYNVGDDRLQDGEIIGEQAEVLSDLSLPSTSYRNLTAHFWERKEEFFDRLKPAIIGKLFLEQAGEMEKVYLIATDQNPEVKEREKDTLYAAELIKFWLEHNFKHLSENVEIIALGPDGTNPSNFEQMFRWWRKTWREQKIAVKTGQPIWACIKGGVGQASEALRISGLSRYQEQIQFFEFQQNTKANRAGIPSDYTGPFLGVNYLWDRGRQQALSLLERYDYDGVLELLNEGYFKKNPSSWSAVPTLIKAGLAWNQGNFKQFFQLVKSSLVSAEQTRDTKWWWMAYEQAQLAVVRLSQQNTAEAMLHSFRAIEGCLWEWSVATFPDVQAGENQYSLLSDSILTKYPGLHSCFVDNSGNRLPQIQLRRRSQQALVEASITKAIASRDLSAFWDKKAQNARDRLSHRLGGIAEMEVFEAWGTDIRNSEQWQRRLLNCLNLITGQSFRSLSEASLFTGIHQRVIEAIEQYEPTV